MTTRNLGEDLTPVGGCHGIVLVPSSGLADYYLAHAYAAFAAAVLLALAFLAGLTP
jgi:hypothetical protein